MLIDHKIKLDVESELKLPPPRKVRRRRGRGLPIKLAHLIFMPFILAGMIFILGVYAAALDILDGRKPVSSIWPLIFFCLVWNAFTAIFVWRLYVLPFVNRWLVVHGHATVGHITAFTHGSRGGEPEVQYEFSTKDGRAWKQNALVQSMAAWKELREGNTVIDVMYSPRNPKRNIPYICADYEVVPGAEPI